MMAKYKPYPSYINSDIEWIDKFPSAWKITRVKFESYVKARVGWHGLKSEDFTDEGPYLVTGSDFRGPEIDWEKCYHCDLDRYEQDPYIQLHDGDLLITKDGTIGKVALVRNLRGRATLNSGVFVVRPLSNNYTSSFYFWLLQSSVFTGFVDFNKTGSTIVHLYQDTFVNFKYALPSLNEQHTIADFLDHETAKIDRLIEKQKQLIELLKEKRQAVISHAVTKGLDPNVKMKDSGVEWLGMEPEHWIISRVKFVAKLESGHTPSKKVDEYWIDCDIPWVSLNDSKYLASHDYISETAQMINEKGIAGSSARLLPPGIVVFTRDATIGLTAITTREMAVSQHIIAWVPGPRVLSAYLKRVFDAMKSELDRFTFGATIKTIGMDDVKTLVTPVPPIEEQKQICSHIDNQLSKIDLLIQKAKEQVKLFQERRAALISAAVTGKIDVRNWRAETQSAA